MVKTHKPSGIPAWPIMLLAGGEKCGKSYSATEFSSSDLIDKTFWIEFGEHTAEEYGAMPGARFEIVDHDGTFDSVLEQVEDIITEPYGNKPNSIVIDSMGKIWETLSDEQATIAKRRGKTVITMDQWNVAKKRWASLFGALMRHYGPVILTARYEQVAVMDDRGQPTGKKEWKIKAEKNLGFDVDATILMPEPQRYFLSGVKSLVFKLPPGGNLELPDFTIDRFIRKLGIADLGGRNFVPPKENPPTDDQATQKRVSFDDFDGKNDHES